jgi:hypothetical protein
MLIHMFKVKRVKDTPAAYLFVDTFIGWLLCEAGVCGHVYRLAVL